MALLLGVSYRFSGLFSQGFSVWALVLALVFESPFVDIQGSCADIWGSFAGKRVSFGALLRIYRAVV